MYSVQVTSVAAKTLNVIGNGPVEPAPLYTAFVVWVVTVAEAGAANRASAITRNAIFLMIFKVYLLKALAF